MVLYTILPIKREREKSIMEENKQKDANEETKELEPHNSDKRDFTFDTENLKNETSSTIDQVRETIKKVNLKEDTAETKGFLLEFVKNPINQIKEIANTDRTYFKTAIVLLIIWAAAEFAKILFYVIDFNSLSNFLRYGLLDSIISIILATISPVLGIVVLSLILLIMNKERKKSLSAIIATVTLAKTPSILAAVINLLTIINSQVYKITVPVSGFCRVISTVLLYFGIKELFQKDDDNSFVKTFVVIEAIYFVASFILSFLNISL